MTAILEKLSTFVKYISAIRHRTAYIRSTDRRQMIEIERLTYVSRRSARRLGLTDPVKRKKKPA